MPEALQHVADMTRSRDRGQVDASLLSALMDLLPLRRVLLWRVLGEPGGQRAWQQVGSHAAGALVPSVDHIGADLPEPLPYDRLPAHVECFEQLSLVHQPVAGGHGVMLPTASEREVEGVVELELDEPLDAAHLRVVQTLLKIHRNFLGLLDYSERDTLTGLLNRKSFDDTFLRATVLEAARIDASPRQRRRRAVAAASGGTGWGCWTSTTSSRSTMCTAT